MSYRPSLPNTLQIKHLNAMMRTLIQSNVCVGFIHLVCKFETQLKFCKVFLSEIVYKSLGSLPCLVKGTCNKDILVKKNILLDQPVLYLYTLSSCYTNTYVMAVRHHFLHWWSCIAHLLREQYIT